MNALLRPLREKDLEMLFKWRNSPDVRRFMYTTEEIRWEGHVRWFEGISSDGSRHPLILDCDGVPAGFVNIGPVKFGGVSPWGFYAAPGSRKGTGRALGNEALRFAFEVLGLHKICGEALAFNEASRRLHLALGFREEGMLVDQHFDGDKYHDVVLFGMTLPTWKLVHGASHAS